MSAHTPTPWSVMEHPSGSDLIVQIDEEFSESICEFPYGADASPHRENAAFIVKACNAHDALVAALRTARNLLHHGGEFSERARAVGAINDALALAGEA